MLEYLKSQNSTRFCVIKQLQFLCFLFLHLNLMNENGNDSFNEQKTTHEWLTPTVH